jgi:hypothetical protein
MRSWLILTALLLAGCAGNPPDTDATVHNHATQDEMRRHVPPPATTTEQQPAPVAPLEYVGLDLNGSAAWRVRFQTDGSVHCVAKSVLRSTLDFGPKHMHRLTIQEAGEQIFTGEFYFARGRLGHIQVANVVTHDLYDTVVEPRIRPLVGDDPSFVTSVTFDGTVVKAPVLDWEWVVSGVDLWTAEGPAADLRLHCDDPVPSSIEVGRNLALNDTIHMDATAAGSATLGTFTVQGKEFLESEAPAVILRGSMFESFGVFRLNAPDGAHEWIGTGNFAVMEHDGGPGPWSVEASMAGFPASVLLAGLHPATSLADIEFAPSS